LAGPGDVVYCDPPYVTDAQVKAGFTAYAKGQFTLADQQLLAETAKSAAQRGATVIISNHDTPYTRDLYTQHGGELVFFDVQRNISCNGQKRHKAAELLAVFRPKETA
jgi:DNA adenine methylase